MNPGRLSREWEDIGLHAPSRSSYDPGEKLTVTGLSSVPSSAGGAPREKSITDRTGC